MKGEVLMGAGRLGVGVGVGWVWGVSRRLVLVFGLVFGLVLGVGVGSAVAGEAGVPEWSVSAVSRPSLFSLGGGGSFVVLVTNTGGAASSGVVTVTDELPAGVVSAGGVQAEDELGRETHAAGHDFSGGCGGTGSGGVSCTFSGVVAVDDTLILRFPVRVAGSVGELSGCAGEAVPVGAVGCVANVVRVSGGGGGAAGMRTPTGVYGSVAGAAGATVFGLSPGGVGTALSSVQAGAHPDITTSVAFNTGNAAGATAGNLKNISDDLPAGFAGDLVDTPTCPGGEFLAEECPVASQVGVTTVILHGNLEGPHLEPVYNLAPEPGQVAKIGFSVIGQYHYEGAVAVRAPGEAGEPYGLRATFFDSTAGPVEVDNVSLTIWGVPAAAVHDPLRAYKMVQAEAGVKFGVSSSATAAPYFTNPTSCGGPLQAQLSVTSWQEREPGAAPAPPATGMSMGPIVGCDRLLMEPSLTAEVTSDAPYSATGFDFATRIPQTYENAEGLATSTLEDEVVTLPEGMTINPSSGAGLGSCSEAQYVEEGTPEKTAGEREAGHGCPRSSKLASVKIATPSLKEEVQGSVFLAEPAPRGELGKNPFNSLLAVYLIARVPARGVLVKAPGEITLNPETGRLTTTFDDLPPLPFSLATFDFNQGANAPLVTPPACGDYTVTARLTPYSDPEMAPLEPAIPPFAISSGCPAGGAPPFHPQLTAGTENPDAGAYSPLLLRISRQDGEQEITGFSTLLPPGVSGDLNGVAECPEADIQAAREATGVQEEQDPSCPAGSEIGHSIAEAGVGSVLAQTPGRIYLGGPFEGAPFSIVSVTSAHVGPFDLGTVVVHFPLQINSRTAQVSIPEGAADQIPHIIKGVVIHLRSILVYISREHFMINPTSCEPKTIAAEVIGGGAEPANPADNTPVAVSGPFRVTACQALKFKPVLAVTTAGKASKANGASLRFKISYPAGAITSQSWFNEAKFDFPKQLPARLSTIQQACLARTFENNRPACPAASIIGHATVHTQILAVPLEGPVYFVSYGSAKFPEAVFALQGDGISIELHGETFIDNKTGVTSATFRDLPDVPFESIEVSVPTGPYSEFGTNLPAKDKYNLCGQKLVMPTLLKASNNTTIKQNTTINITGCKTKKHKTKTKKHAKRRKR